MNTASLLFPHQLFRDNPLLGDDSAVYLVEEPLFFTQYRFHRGKLAFHRAGMRYYQAFLKAKGVQVHYIEAIDPLADTQALIEHLAGKGVQQVRFIDPTDDWLAQRIRSAAQSASIQLQELENPQFLNSRDDLTGFFKPDKKSFFQTEFYRQQRKKRQILLDQQGRPDGGKWSYDSDNRKKYPKGKIPPKVESPEQNACWQEALDYVGKHFCDNPGELRGSPLYPLTHDDSEAWLQQFLEQRFAEFGAYEDAIVHDQSALHHSLLSPLLNVGMLMPEQVIKGALMHAREHDIPLNSLEGFVRQVLGWREFMRGMYASKGRYSRSRNFWGFKREMPASFYSANTGIEPVDQTIRKVMQTGYCHHIERLMVLGNFMLLCEIDPDAVYQWFMELFIDAYDWVMVPNVYGMSQFSDGGLFATKPYISGSNYLMKMSDYGKGEWQSTWDGLFWRFMHVHRDFFVQNPRLGMLLRNFDRMDAARQNAHLAAAERYLERLDSPRSE